MSETLTEKNRRMDSEWANCLAENRGADESDDAPAPGCWTAVPDPTEPGKWFVHDDDEFEVVASGLSERDAKLIASAPSMSRILTSMVNPPHSGLVGVEEFEEIIQRAA